MQSLISPLGRRDFIRVCLAACGAAALPPALGLTVLSDSRPKVSLTQQQTRAFRAWMLRIIGAQLERGPSPRWQHRDCAGLVRYAVNEALAAHDAKWLRANGIPTDPRLPAELELTPQQAALRNHWNLPGGGSGHFVAALGLVQENSRYIARDVNLAQPGDLLFFDQGDDQHLMVWMGTRIAYHTGSVRSDDNGLRTVDVQQLMTWKDTRWQPAVNNPNFAGVFRLAFLTP